MGAPSAPGCAEFFAALASDARIRILEALKEGPKYGGQLQPLVGLDQSVVSRHLAVLRRVGLVRGEKEGNAVRFHIADERVYEILALARQILATRVEKERGLLGEATRPTEPQARRSAMRIAFAAESPEGLDSTISAHFGRCPYYVFVDVEGDQVKSVETVENPFYYDHGAPGQVPAFIANRGANVIVSGGMGPRAIAFFEQFGVDVVTGVSGSVRDALQAYLKSETARAEPCEDHKHEHRGEEPSAMSSLAEELRRLREHAKQLEERIQALQRILQEADKEGAGA